MCSQGWVCLFRTPFEYYSLELQPIKQFHSISIVLSPNRTPRSHEILLEKIQEQ